MKTNFNYDVEKIGKGYLQLLKEENKYKHSINQNQFIKLKRIANCLVRAGVQRHNIKLNIEPDEIHGGLTASFEVLSLTQMDLKPLFYALTNASAISIDSTLDGKVVLSCTVPNLYKRC